jgi:hypothetical protein
MNKKETMTLFLERDKLARKSILARKYISKECELLEQSTPSLSMIERIEIAMKERKKGENE